MSVSLIPASAAVYTTEAAFDLANPGLTTVTFGGVTSSITHPGSPFSIGGVTLNAGNLAIISPNFWGAPFDHAIDDTFAGTVSLSLAGSTAFGLYVSSGYQNATNELAISACNGTTLLYAEYTIRPGWDNFSFFCIDGVGTITSVVVSSAGVVGGFPGIGPISYGVASAVPEPATWAMMLVGFAGLGFAARRRQLQSA